MAPGDVFGRRGFEENLRGVCGESGAITVKCKFAKELFMRLLGLYRWAVLLATVLFELVFVMGCSVTFSSKSKGGGVTRDSRLFCGRGEVWQETVERCSITTNGGADCAGMDFAFFADGTFWGLGPTGNNVILIKHNATWKGTVGTWSTNGNKLTYLFGTSTKYSVSDGILTIFQAGFEYDKIEYKKKTGVTIFESYDDFRAFTIREECKEHPDLVDYYPEYCK